MKKITYTKNHKNEIEFTNSWDSDKYILNIADNVLDIISELLPHVQENASYFLASHLSKVQTDSLYYLIASKIDSDANIKFYLFDNPYINEKIDDRVQNISHDFSPYIDKESAVLFLNEGDMWKYAAPYQNYYVMEDNEIPSPGYKLLCEARDKGIVAPNFVSKVVSLIIPELHSENIQEINNTCKDLKKRYGVKRIELVVTHFYNSAQPYEKGNGRVFNTKDAFHPLGGHVLDFENFSAEFCHIDKLITTNSTQVLEVSKEPHEYKNIHYLTSNESLKSYLDEHIRYVNSMNAKLLVIDCVEFFKNV